MKKKEVSDLLRKIAGGLTKLADALNVISALADDITALADLLGAGDEKATLKKKETAADAAPEKEEQTEKPAEEDIKFEDVRALLAEKAAAGHRQEVKDLLKEYGLKCLSDIAEKPELFREVMEKAEAWT